MIFLLFLIETICCDPSSEPSRQDGSDEGSQHMFLCRINKIHLLLSPNTPSDLELFFCFFVVVVFVFVSFCSVASFSYGISVRYRTISLLHVHLLPKNPILPHLRVVPF